VSTSPTRAKTPIQLAHVNIGEPVLQNGIGKSRAPHYVPRLGWGFLLPWILSGIFLVPSDQQAVVTRFGAVMEPRVTPGIHYALPWPVDRVFKLKV